MDSAEPLPDWTIGCFFDKYATRGRGDRERRILRARASAGVGRGVRRDLQGIPPRQKPSSFSVDQIMETLQSRKVADNLVPLADVPIEPVDRFKM